MSVLLACDWCGKPLATMTRERTVEWVKCGGWEYTCEACRTKMADYETVARKEGDLPRAERARREQWDEMIYRALCGGAEVKP